MVSFNGTVAPSHREVMHMYQLAFDARVKAGEIRPALVPHDGYGLLALIIYLCIPHVNRPWLYAARLPLLAWIVAFNFNIILGTRSMYAGTGFGMGLIAAWVILWSMTWLLWNSPQFDAKRVQRRGNKILTTVATNPQTIDEDPPSNGEIEIVSNGGANKEAVVSREMPRRRQTQNGHTRLEKQDSRRGVDQVKDGEQEEAAAETEYYWQTYPIESFQDRFDWVCDLVFNFRGPGWNWEVPSNPGLPAHVKVGLGEPVDIKSMRVRSSTGIRRFTSRTELVRIQIPRLIFGYFFLDVLKVVLMKDPYFTLGPNEFPLPPHLADLSPTLINMIRQLLSLAGIVTALESIFLLAPLCLCLILGPNILNARGEYWEYPTTWGSFENITKRGLQGLWGGWWHQTFRFAFSAPTNFLIRHGILDQKSLTTKLFGAVVAFAMSGFLHGSGSYTQVPSTLPMNCLLFFMLQAAGIVLQSSFCAYFKKSIRRLPMMMRTSGNFAFAFTWLYCTSPLLVDDFARGGVWLFQPVPISPLRALGYGEPGDSWWCYEDIRPKWHVGKHWWEIGLAF